VPTRVYIETTIPSAYHSVRTEPEMIARRNWTREWWDNRRGDYEIVTSDAVIDEPSRGDHPDKAAKLALLKDIPLMEITARAEEVAGVYIERKLMPRDSQGDALHLALASVHNCDILLTWNCQHLANYNKATHIRRVNTELGLHVPALITPFELLEGDDYER
jgi:predicted nucleic acid-binding protein